MLKQISNSCIAACTVSVCIGVCLGASVCTVMPARIRHAAHVGKTTSSDDHELFAEASDTSNTKEPARVAPRRWWGFTKSNDSEHGLGIVLVEDGGKIISAYVIHTILDRGLENGVVYQLVIEKQTSRELWGAVPGFEPPEDRDESGKTSKFKIYIEHGSDFSGHRIAAKWGVPSDKGVEYSPLSLVFVLQGDQW